MENFSERLKIAMKIRNLKPSELSEKANIPKSAISQYLSGLYEAKQKSIFKLSEALNVSEAWLMGLDAPMEKKTKKSVKIPVLGSVAAGVPIEAIQDIIDYEEIEEDLAKKGEFFGLKVKGDSMFPYIIDKDIAIVKKQPNCESGQIAVVQVNGNDATIKKVVKEENSIILKPFNPMYAPIVINTKNLENPVAIIGVVVEIRRKELAL